MIESSDYAVYEVSAVSKQTEKYENHCFVCVNNIFGTCTCRRVCVPSWRKGGCGGLRGFNRGPTGGCGDTEPREAEGLLFGLLPWIRSWRPLWEWPGVGLLWELQSGHSMHQWWGYRTEECREGQKNLVTRWPYIYLVWFQWVWTIKT